VKRWAEGYAQVSECAGQLLLGKTGERGKKREPPIPPKKKTKGSQKAYNLTVGEGRRTEGPLDSDAASVCREGDRGWKGT